MAARRTLREGLKRFDKETNEGVGFIENILEQGQDLDTYFHPEWQQIFYEGQIIHGLVLESTPEEAPRQIRELYRSN